MASVLANLIEKISHQKAQKKSAKTKLLDFEKMIADQARSQGMLPRTYLEQLCGRNESFANSKLVRVLIGEKSQDDELPAFLKQAIKKKEKEKAQQKDLDKKSSAARMATAHAEEGLEAEPKKCDHCNGTGKHGDEDCEVCGGRGYTTEGNEFAQKVRQMKAAGAKKGTKFKTSDGEEHTLEDLKFQNKFKIGDKIKAYDFEPSPGRPDRFVIGTVIKVDAESESQPGALGYHIKVDDEEPKRDRIGKTVFIPYEMSGMEYDNRVTAVEGKMSDIDLDMKELSDAEFKRKYKKTKDEMQKDLSEDDNNEPAKLKGGVSAKQIQSFFPNVEDQTNFLQAIMKAKAGTPITALPQVRAFAQAFKQMLEMDPTQTQKLMMMLRRIQAESVNEVVDVKDALVHLQKLLMDPAIQKDRKFWDIIKKRYDQLRKTSEPVKSQGV